MRFYIHYKLNMLGLILTTTSLPPPVWTHNHCLFKLVLRHFLSVDWHYQNCFLWCQVNSDSSDDFSIFTRAVVASLSIDYMVAFSPWGRFTREESYWVSCNFSSSQIRSVLLSGLHYYIRSVATSARYSILFPILFYF